MNGAPSTLVSPGLWGFVAFFVLAVALYLLMRNMNARMRRMSYRAEELRREAEADRVGGKDAEGAEGGERQPGANAEGQPGEGTGDGRPEGQDDTP